MEKEFLKINGKDMYKYYVLREGLTALCSKSFFPLPFQFIVFLPSQFIISQLEMDNTAR